MDAEHPDLYFVQINSLIEIKYTTELLLILFITFEISQVYELFFVFFLEFCKATSKLASEYTRGLN